MKKEYKITDWNDKLNSKMIRSFGVEYVNKDIKEESLSFSKFIEDVIIIHQNTENKVYSWEEYNLQKDMEKLFVNCDDKIIIDIFKLCYYVMVFCRDNRIQKNGNLEYENDTRKNDYDSKWLKKCDPKDYKNLARIREDINTFEVINKKSHYDFEREKNKQEHWKLVSELVNKGEGVVDFDINKNKMTYQGYMGEEISISMVDDGDFEGVDEDISDICDMSDVETFTKEDEMKTQYGLLIKGKNKLQDIRWKTPYKELENSNNIFEHILSSMMIGVGAKTLKVDEYYQETRYLSLKKLIVIAKEMEKRGLDKELEILHPELLKSSFDEYHIINLREGRDYGFGSLLEVIDKSALLYKFKINTSTDPLDKKMLEEIDELEECKAYTRKLAEHNLIILSNLKLWKITKNEKYLKSTEKVLDIVNYIIEEHFLAGRQSDISKAMNYAEIKEILDLDKDLEIISKYKSLYNICKENSIANLDDLPVVNEQKSVILKIDLEKIVAIQNKKWENDLSYANINGVVSYVIRGLNKEKAEIVSPFFEIKEKELSLYIQSPNNLDLSYEDLTKWGQLLAKHIFVETKIDKKCNIPNLCKEIEEKYMKLTMKSKEPVKSKKVGVKF